MVEAKAFAYARRRSATGDAAMYKLYGRPGWGSTLVEAQLSWYGLAYEIVEVDDLFASAGARDTLLPLNPLAQVPTLILPGRQVMTESAAITLHLAEITGSGDLVPAPGEAIRPDFLRWLIFIVANLYPTFTYVDDPARFVADPTAQQGFLASVSAYRERLWGQVEGVAHAPWFFAERFTALDIYITVMTRWRPRREWFAANCPKLHATALRAEAEPRLAAVWRRNFSQG
jgi:GST-like protein